MSAPCPRRSTLRALRACALAGALAGALPTAAAHPPHAPDTEASPDADDGLSLSVALDASEVRSGRAFEFVVTTSFHDDLEPRAWDDDAWRPLFVRRVDGERTRSGATTRETTRYRAWVFGEGQLALTPPPLVAAPRAGGAPRRAVAEPVALTVVAALDDDAAPEPEWPGPPRDGPLTTISLVLRVGAASALAALAALVLRARTRPPHEARETRLERGTSLDDEGRSTHEAARDAALAALDALRADVADEARPSVDAFARDASGALRAYVAARFGLPTVERTSPEIVRALRPLVPGDALASLLARCDAIKFGRALPDAGARTRMLDDAVAFVRACGVATSAAHAARPAREDA